MGSTKTIRRERQVFGPTETDKKLPYFVCWDTEPNPDVAKHQAQFSSEGDAEAFFALKCKEKGNGIYVWRGVLGIATDGFIDWFHTHWSDDGVKNPEAGLGSPWSAFGVKFEEFEPYKPCCPTEES